MLVLGLEPLQLSNRLYAIYTLRLQCNPLDYLNISSQFRVG